MGLKIKGKRIIYNPFDFDAGKQAEQDSDLAKEIGHHIANNRPVLPSAQELDWNEPGAKMTSIKTIRSKPGGQKPLEKVVDDDILVINAHGSKDGACIGYRDGHIGPGPHEHRMRILSVFELATMIVEDGLPPTHRLIKLNSCYAAGNPAQLSKPEQVKIAAANSFVAKFAERLGKLGYKEILVGGYPGSFDLKLRSTGKRLMDEEQNVFDPSEIGGRLWFGWDGQPSEKPEIDYEDKD